MTSGAGGQCGQRLPSGTGEDGAAAAQRPESKGGGLLVKG